MGWQTLLVTCCTCFLAGSTFHHWVADHNTLWLNPTTEEAVSRAAEYYALLGSVRYTPLPYIWLGVAGVALSTMGWRAVRGITNIGGERFSGGYLFDAACCLLLGRVILTQAKDVFPAVLHLSLPRSSSSSDLNTSPEKKYQALENDVKLLAGTNLTISVLLTGVICLQAGRFYAERSAAKKRIQYLSHRSQTQTPSPLENVTNSIESSTTPIPSSPSGSTRSKGRRRAQTPYREMTQEEMDELTRSGVEAK